MFTQWTLKMRHDEAFPCETAGVNPVVYTQDTGSVMLNSLLGTRSVHWVTTWEEGSLEHWCVS